MKKNLLVIMAIMVVRFSLAQNTLEIRDTGNITRERWRDSLLRMDKTRYQPVF